MSVASSHFEPTAARINWRPRYRFEQVIDDICDLSWESVSNEEVIFIAFMYYFFSIQFCENLELALAVYPDDLQLKLLYGEECETDNLSPWAGIAELGERMNHDEFVRRLLLLSPNSEFERLRDVGELYLRRTRSIEPSVRAASIASYEDQGLSKVFEAMLRAPVWRGSGQAAFRHFLEKHIEFDSGTDQGHGALTRHLKPDDSILPLWVAFRDILVMAAPSLSKGKGRARA